MMESLSPGPLKALAISLLLLGILAGCRDDESPEGSPGQDHVTWSDHEALFLIETLPMGMTFEEVRAILPSAETPVAGEGPLSNLSSTATSGSVLGHPGTLELNFADGILYSHYFRIEPGCEEAERLIDLLRSRYTAEYGRGIHEAEQSTGYAMDSSFWDAGEADVALTLGRQSGQCRLAWGYQDTRS
jgi:hypothetical protein